MTIFRHELRQGRLSLVIWTAAICFMLGICILIYPSMSGSMDDISAIFANMGEFSAAFGMDRIDFGSFLGFFGVECGNILGLGGALFAALTGASMLCKEEKEHTAEFLLTHPISRLRVVTEKLAAVLAQVLCLDLAAVAVTCGGMAIVDASAPAGTMTLLFAAYGLLHLQVAAVTFGISAFLKRGGIGLGLGFAAGSYFLNIVANLTEGTSWLKYLTPFGYTDSADIIVNEAISGGCLAVGLAMAAVGIAAAYARYLRKDIA